MCEGLPAVWVPRPCDIQDSIQSHLNTLFIPKVQLKGTEHHIAHRQDMRHPNNRITKRSHFCSRRRTVMDDVTVETPSWYIRWCWYIFLWAGCVTPSRCKCTKSRSSSKTPMSRCCDTVTRQCVMSPPSCIATLWIQHTQQSFTEGGKSKRTSPSGTNTAAENLSPDTSHRHARPVRAPDLSEYLRLAQSLPEGPIGLERRSHTWGHLCGICLCIHVCDVPLVHCKYGQGAEKWFAAVWILKHVHTHLQVFTHTEWALQRMKHSDIQNPKMHTGRSIKTEVNCVSSRHRTHGVRHRR